MGQTPAALQQLSWMDRIDYGLHQVKEIVGRVWIYIILGIGAGAAIHGYVPEGFMASIMGKQAWWSVPAAVLLGAPLYSNAAGIIPVVQALLEKGAALGTVLAFMMSIIAHLLSGSRHPPEGIEAQADRGVRRRGHRGDYHRRLYFQRHYVMEESRE